MCSASLVMKEMQIKTTMTYFAYEFGKIYICVYIWYMRDNTAWGMGNKVSGHLIWVVSFVDFS